MTEWEIHGMDFTNCNCAYGCPCQFNALPTHGNCRAVVFVRIDRGRFGTVPLDGLAFASAVMWPGAIHEGHGTMQPIIDRRADAAQREVLFRIMTGQDTEDAATIFWVVAHMCDTIHAPIYTDIAIDVDMERRTARCEAAGIASGRGEPILNPVTGAEHRVGIVLPNGFEYTQNEVGRGWSESSGSVAMRLEDSYAHWCALHMNQHGVVREQAVKGEAVATA